MFRTTCFLLLITTSRGANALESEPTAANRSGSKAVSCQNWTEASSWRLSHSKLQQIETLLQVTDVSHEGEAALPVGAPDAAGGGDDCAPPQRVAPFENITCNMCSHLDIELSGAVDVNVSTLRAALEDAREADDESMLVLKDRQRGPQTVHTGGDLYAMDDDNDDDGVQLRQTQRLDLSLLVALLDSAEPTLEYVEGKDVVMLLGTTGVGKSSLIQALDGRHFFKQRYSRVGGENHEVEVWVADSELEEFAIGHDLVSKTKGIRHYSKGNVTYVDSPGFKDTGGVEVDISTALSFVRVARGCRSLRFVVMINSATFLQDRGGSMRSLVALVQSFVGDFKTHRLAFSFVFTHTDSLPDATSKSVADVKSLIRNYLNETRYGTPDKNVKMILKWMVKCLHEGFPFVDIFHPVLSDVSALRTRFEMFEALNDSSFPAIGLAPNQRPLDVVRCGLTGKAVSTLKNELDRLRMDADRIVAKGSFGEMAALRNGVDRLMTHVPEIEEISTACQQIVERIQQHAHKLKESIGAQIEEGGGVESRVFGVENARRTVEELFILHALEEFFPNVPGTAQDHMDFLHRKLRGMLGMMCQDLCDSTSRMPLVAPSFAALRKLRAWSHAHQSFLPYADRGSKMLEAHIQSCVRDAQDAPDVISSVLSLAHLEQISNSFLGLDGEGEKVDEVIRVRDNVSRIVGDAIRESSVAATSAFQKVVQTVFGGLTGVWIPAQLDVSLHEFSESTSILEALCEALSSAGNLPDLQDGCSAEAHKLSELVVFEIKPMFSKVMARARAVETCRCNTTHLAVELQELTQVEQTLSLKLNVITGAEAQLLAIAGVVNKSVELWFQELHLLLDDVKRGVEGDMSKMVVLFRSLQDLQEVGSLATVKTRLVQFKKRVFSRLVEAFRGCLKLFVGLLCPQRHDVFLSEMETLQRELSVMYNLSDTGEVWPEVGAARRLFDQTLASILDAWVSHHGSAALTCPGTVDEMFDFCARNVETVLAVCTHLRGVVVPHGSFDDLCEPVREKLLSLGASFDRLLAQPEHFAQQAHVMESADSWDQQNLVLIAEALPTRGERSRKLRESLGRHVAKLRDVIDESLDTNRVEAIIEDLDKAHVLDAWLDQNWLQHQVNMLRSILSLKQTRLSETLKAKIENCDLEHVYELIKPLKDPHRGTAWLAISECVRRDIDLAMENISNGELLSKSIGRLQQTHENIGSEFWNTTSVDVAGAVLQLQSKGSARFGQMVHDLKSAAGIEDFRGIVVNQRRAKAYYRSVQSFVSDKKTLAVEALSEARKCLDMLRETMAAFVDRFDSIEHLGQAGTRQVYERLGKLKLFAGDSEDDVLDYEDERWKVVGGESTGLDVTLGPERDSAKLAGKLSHGAVIMELEMNGTRIRYQLVEGVGPTQGWVSTSERYMLGYGRTQVVQKEEPLLPLGMPAREMRHLYENVSQSISVKVSKWIEHVESTPGFASASVRLLLALQREMGKGLRDHIFIRIDVDGLLEGAKRREEEASNEWRKMLRTPAGILDTCAPELDNWFHTLKISLGSLNLWAGRTEYDQRVEQITLASREICRTAHQSLDERSYEQAGRDALLLVHIAHNLSSHIKDVDCVKGVEEAVKRDL